MKRKNLKVGLRVELKKGYDHLLPDGAGGVVEGVEPEEYTGCLTCRVRFEGRYDTVWVSESEIRIAYKVRKVKPKAGEQAL